MGRAGIALEFTGLAETEAILALGTSLLSGHLQDRECCHEHRMAWSSVQPSLEKMLISQPGQSPSALDCALDALAATWAKLD